MRRLLAAAVMATLALPVAVLGAMVFAAERNLAAGGVMRVAIRGYDPRDMLRGHYLNYRFDWSIEPSFIGRTTRICVLSAPSDAPARVRALAASGDWASTVLPSMCQALTLARPALVMARSMVSCPLPSRSRRSSCSSSMAGAPSRPRHGGSNRVSAARPAACSSPPAAWRADAFTCLSGTPSSWSACCARAGYS